MTRLRQAVLAASDLAAARSTLEAVGLRDPFRDLGVKEFGLDNAVYLVGDSLLPIGEASPPIGRGYCSTVRSAMRR